jgi:TolB protein
VAEQERFEDLEKRFPGRLALLDPRRAVAQALPIAGPGALPRAWSPDHERLMFTRLVDGYRQLAEWNRETDEVRALTRGPWVYPDGCYGPEERLVLVQAGVVEGRAVARVALSEPRGVRPVVVSEGPSDYAPACAPDGRAVAWVSTNPDGRDVLKVRAPVVDGEVRVLGPGRAPAFSPDGEWLVYSARIGDRWALHRIRADGSGRRRIGTGSIDELEASFSPDGRLLVYVGDDGLNQRLYLRRFDGTGGRVLLEAGGGSSPVW